MLGEVDQNVKLLYTRGDTPEYNICIKQDKIAIKIYENLRKTGLDDNELKTFSENTDYIQKLQQKLKNIFFLLDIKIY